MVNQGLSEYAVCSQYTADYANNLSNILGRIILFLAAFCKLYDIQKGQGKDMNELHSTIRELLVAAEKEFSSRDAIRFKVKSDDGSGKKR